ncbi:hypothetical protein [Chlorogloea sp. CCALA 695]|uniref:hypothetical protein n=1 Tax=Chlorogloea sp. CCALA 695 TaxID=2107693 RepID=UPI000D060CC0|nr:hypothetical protein [Chlorogloea sp. CCALA 695]PSB25463.1 hypothetical protein C7B70_24780 [Chlorogloea sp. CCALA 695]
MAETREQAWTRITKELENKRTSLRRDRISYKGMQLDALVMTIWGVDSATMQATSWDKPMITEKALATALGTSTARVHHDCLRNPMFKHAKVRKLWDLDSLIGSEWHYDRLSYQGETYNPIWLYDSVIKDLATRRPYLQTAKEALASA